LRGLNNAFKTRQAQTLTENINLFSLEQLMLSHFWQERHEIQTPFCFDWAFEALEMKSDVFQ